MATEKERRKKPESEGGTTFFVATSEDAAQAETHEREDFFRDLKKVVKKLPSDHPSRSGSQKH